jgi:alpha-beta hydrolase superfamily lysophospholipase
MTGLPNTTKAVKRIVIILHGYDCKISMYRALQEVIEEVYTETVVVLPKLAMTTFSVADPDEVVLGILQKIDAVWTEKTKGHEEEWKLVIIGHSTGALLARKAYVVACGEHSDAPFEDIYKQQTAARPWAAHVDRIILLAGMNRGWTLDPHLYTKTALMIRAGLVVGAVFRFFGRTPFAFKTRRGAPFITQLRLQWLAMSAHAGKGLTGNAPVIQLLGTKDDLVSPEDNIDLVTGGNFIYLEIPASNHLTVLKLKEPVYGEARRKIFELVLLEKPDELLARKIQPADPGFMQVDNEVTDVVFVIHGIRDTGYWTQKIARRVKITGDKETNRKFATETSSYGYFGMLPFLLSFARRQKVEWLMDQYTENKAIYPNARFSFVGHSNGTYLLAKAMTEYPACSFKHVVFAGSVVSASFRWDEMIAANRIEKFFNFVASADWVVAIFPKSFQALRLQDLGSGGFDGFTSIRDTGNQFQFAQGSHGAAIEEKFWDEIAHLIVHGTPKHSIKNTIAPERSRFMKILGAAAPFPFIFILLVVLMIPVCIILYMPGGNGWVIAMLIIYLLVIRRAVTKL